MVNTHELPIETKHTGNWQNPCLVGKRGERATSKQRAEVCLCPSHQDLSLKGDNVFFFFVFWDVGRAQGSGAVQSDWRNSVVLHILQGRQIPDASSMGM